MKITWHNSEYTILARVYPYADLWLAAITVSRDRSLRSRTWDPVFVSWPSIGAQGIQDTETFALALQEAVRLGKEMAGPVHSYPVTYTISAGAEPLTHRVVGNNKAQAVASYQNADLKGGTLTIGEAEE